MRLPASEERPSTGSVRVAPRAGSKQSNQSWLNELLIISRTRQSGEGNCPYNGGAKCAAASYICDERWEGGGTGGGMAKRLVGPGRY